MQPPIAGQVVLGWDPAFRTGCKLAVVDATGKVLDTTVVYPTAPTNEKKIAAAKAIAELISDEELSEDNIIPKAFDKRVGPAVAKAVA